MDELRDLFRRPLTLDPLWFFLPILGIVFAISLNPIPPHDYWWALVMGREILKSGAIPESNLFLYTLEQGAPFHNQPWLGQVWLYQLRHFGDGASVIVRNVLSLVGMGLVLFAALRRASDPRVVGLLGMAFLTVMIPTLSVRTQIFALVPFAYLIWSIFAVAEGRKWLWLLPNVFLAVIWANTHGSFVLGPVLLLGALGAIVIEDLDRREFRWRIWLEWSGVWCLVTLATFLNPSGWSIYGYVVHLAVSSNVASTVTEWAPPDVQTAHGQVFLALHTAGLIILWIHRKRLRIFEVGLLLAVTYLAASSVRNVVWWAMLWVVVLTPHLAIWARGWERSVASVRQGLIHGVILSLLAGLAIVVQPGLLHGAFVDATTKGIARKTGEGEKILAEKTPIEILQKLHKQHDGRVFHDQAIGGLVEWVYAADGPRQVAFVDQRMELIPEEIWQQYFLISNAGPGWMELLDRWQIEVAVLNIFEQWPLIQSLYRESQWEVKYIDQIHVVFVRSLDRRQD